MARRIPDADAPPALGRLNWVFCAEGDDKDAALTALDTALHTDLPYWRRALAKLYTNDAAAAADNAAMALKLKPAYPYYAIWLHVARARAGQNDADEIAANAKKIDRSQWPWPIVALFLGSMNPDETRTAAL